jgi:NAD(P)-dependent dehydrogenase (short-subunit alcohol dehydrogenase family)
MAGVSMNAVVIGSSRGFGRSLADALRDAGWTVAEGARSLPSRKVNTFMAVDVTKDDSVQRFVDWAQSRFHPIHALVYCPADPRGVARSWEVPAVELEAVFDVILFGFLRFVRLLVPNMISAGGGVVLAVGSQAAIEPIPLLAAYGAAKAALEHYVRFLAAELVPHGVRVNSLAISAETALAAAHRQSKEALRGRPSSHPVLPDVSRNIAPALYLLSPASHLITGQRLQAVPLPRGSEL